MLFSNEEETWNKDVASIYTWKKRWRSLDIIRVLKLSLDMAQNIDKNMDSIMASPIDANSYDGIVQLIGVYLDHWNLYNMHWI